MAIKGAALRELVNDGNPPDGALLAWWPPEVGDIARSLTLGQLKTLLDAGLGFLTKAQADAFYEVFGAVNTHTAQSDPHPQYLTEVEGDTRYVLVGGVEAQVLQRGAEFYNGGDPLVAADAQVVYTRSPLGGTIQKVIAYGTGGGSCQFDVYKGAFGTTASICAGNKPQLNLSNLDENISTAGWSLAVLEGDWFGVKLESSSGQTLAGLLLVIS